MTTLELYRKHKKGEIGRDRFLYEVRRDNNLPWITNITSYDDAVKILKNKGIIRESVQTDPIVDSVNPYALKRAVHKLLDKEEVLTNDSYVEALNKAAKKLTSPESVKAEMFANAESVAKADSKLQTQQVKKANHKDKHNEMKKAKGQQTPKATAAPTKENKKTKKPKGVEIMKDKGVEGAEKIIKEITEYLKKKLTENSPYHEYHVGMQVETEYGTAVIKEIDGGTLMVETENGELYDVQMNHVKHFTEKKKEAENHQGEANHETQVDEARASDIKVGNEYNWGDKKVEIVSVEGSTIKARQVGDSEVFILRDPKNLKPITEDQEEIKTNSTITVTVGDAARAIELFRDSPFKQHLNTGEIEMDGTNAYIIKNLEVAEGLLNLFQENGIELIDYELSKEDEEEIDEAQALVVPKTATGQQIDKIAATYPTIKAGQKIDIIRK